MNIVLPDNSNVELENNQNGYDLALKISEGLARNAVAVEINGEVKDIRTELKKRKIEGVKVVYSKETPIKLDEKLVKNLAIEEDNSKKQIPGSKITGDFLSDLG